MSNNVEKNIIENALSIANEQVLLINCLSI